MADLTIGEMWKKIDQFVDSKPDLKGRTMVQLTQGALPCRSGSSLCLSVLMSQHSQYRVPTGISSTGYSYCLAVYSVRQKSCWAQPCVPMQSC